MTSSDIKNYFNTHDWFKYFLLYDDRNGNIYQDNRVYISVSGGPNAEKRWQEKAIKTNENYGGTIDNEGTITTCIVEDIFFANLDKIVDWINNGEERMLFLPEHLENYNVAVYYTPDGERHYTYDYGIVLKRAPKAPLGFIFSLFYCDYPGGRG